MKNKPRARPSFRNYGTERSNGLKDEKVTKTWIEEWHKDSERAEEGNHVTIEVSTNITSVGEVSTVNNSFYADFFMILHWKVSPEALEHIRNVEEYAKNHGPAKLCEFWAQNEQLAPSLEIENAKDVTQVEPDLEERKYPRIDNDLPGYVKRTIRFVGTFRTAFDLRRFPFDCQMLEIKVKFRRMGRQNVQAVESQMRPSKIKLDGIEQGDLVIVPMLESKGGEVGAMSRYTLSLCLHRAWRRYFWNIGLMNFTIAVMGWGVTVLMSPKQVESRLENLQNLLLTAVAFKFAVNDSLPNLPFMTVLDMYVVVNFLFLFFQIMETYVVGALVLDHGDGRDLIPWRFEAWDAAYGPQFEKWWIRCAGSLWVLFQLRAIWFAYEGIRKMELLAVRRATTCVMNALHYRVRKSQREQECSFDVALVDVFKSVDIDGSGFMDEEEWVQFVVGDKIGPTESQARGMFSKLASFGQGGDKIDLDQLAQFLGRPAEGQPRSGRRRSSLSMGVKSLLRFGKSSKGLFKSSKAMVVGTRVSKVAAGGSKLSPLKDLKHNETFSSRDPQYHSHSSRDLSSLVIIGRKNSLVGAVPLGAVPLGAKRSSVTATTVAESLVPAPAPALAPVVHPLSPSFVMSKISLLAVPTEGTGLAPGRQEVGEREGEEAEAVETQRRSVLGEKASRECTGDRSGDRSRVELQQLEQQHKEQLEKLEQQRAEQQQQHEEQLAKLEQQRVEQQQHHHQQLEKMDELVQELVRQRTL
jgi:hypothetical protein